SWMSASANPVNPKVQGNRRARNHHSRASHTVQAKNPTMRNVKNDARGETAGWLPAGNIISMGSAVCFFLFLRHVWKTGYKIPARMIPPRKSTLGKRSQAAP